MRGADVSPRAQRHQKKTKKRYDDVITESSKADYILFQYRLKWRWANRMISFIMGFYRVCTRSALAKEAHLKTFADIGDELLDCSDEALGAKAQVLERELCLSSMAQSILTISRAERTKDQIGTVLCELQNVAGFCSYPLNIQKKIAEYSYFLGIGKKRVIVRQGHPAQYWHYVITGQALVTEITTEPGGKTQRITHSALTRGMSFGELGLRHNQPRKCTVTSRRPMQMLIMGKEKYLDVFEKGIYIDGVLIPDHVAFIKDLHFMKYWPWKNILSYPIECKQRYFLKKKVLVADSTKNKYIYVVRSLVGSTRASWRDLQLSLAHPSVGIDGWPDPKIDTGAKIKKKPRDYTLYNRLSAQDLVEDNIALLPCLRLGPPYGRPDAHRASKPYSAPPPKNRIAKRKTGLPPIRAEQEKQGLSRKSISSKVTINVTPPDRASTEPTTRSDRSDSGARHDSVPTWPRGSVTSPRGSVKSPRGSVTSPRGSVKSPRGSVTSPRGSVTSPRISTDRQSPRASVLTDLQESIDSCGPEDSMGVTGTNRPLSGFTPKISFSSQLTGIAKSHAHTIFMSSPDLKISPSDHALKKKSLAKAKSGYAQRMRYRAPTKTQPPKQQYKKPRDPYTIRSKPCFVRMQTLYEGDVFGLDQLNEEGYENRKQSHKVAL
ncbi:hypothetical protein BaRGS_00015984, partial [Batillaria attramentaria]